MLKLVSILIGIVFVITFAFTVINFQTVEAETTLSLHKPDGIIRNDDRIYIVQHVGYSKLEGAF